MPATKWHLNERAKANKLKIKLLREYENGDWLSISEFALFKCCSRQAMSKKLKDARNALTQ